MAEVKARNLVFVFLILGGIGFVVLTFFGICGGIGFANPEFFQKWFKFGASATLGYTPAKTPNDAAEGFKRAIQSRDYDQVGIYTTKAYGDMLKRAHPTASKLGKTIDKISEYGKNKDYTTDKTTRAFHTLDPFPKNFRIANAPKEEGGKAWTSFAWDGPQYKDAGVDKDNIWQQLDLKMFQNVLGGPTRAFDSASKIEIIKEGDVWKLNIPTTATWEAEVTYYIEKSKSYQTELDNFDGWMLNNRFTKESFETEVLGALKKAKS